MQHAADDRLAFAPPPQPGLLRAGVLAVIAHLLLVAALTSGLQWKREATEVSAEAELWSAVPQQAAPKEVLPPPPPPAPPPVVRAPPPPVVRAPAPPVVRAPDPQVQRDAQIALERDKKKRAQEAERREDAQREAAERKRAERKAEADRKQAADRERKAEDRKLAAERKREEEAEKREQAKLAAENKRKAEAQKKQREAQEEARAAKQREDNLNRMKGLAGGTGSPTSGGSAQVASGPSANWAGRVIGKVRPNIVFSDDVPGNPKAEVEVRMAPDGTIVGKRLVKPSGNKGWDDAVLRALDKTEVLPRDVDGRVHSPVTITFRPKD